MDTLAYELMEQVLIENNYRNLRVVTEHIFDLSRGETSRITIRRTRLCRVLSAAHFAASSLNFHFRAYPPTKEEVGEALKSYRVAPVSGAVLVSWFRELTEQHKDLNLRDELDDVLRSFGRTSWAVRLIDEWNLHCGFCQTEKEFIYLEWFTTA